MSSKSYIERERNSINRFSKYQLPNRFKKLGFFILILSFLGLFINKFSMDSELARSISRYGMLVGLLIVSISKEKIEDELITKIRMQSYTFAFIWGVLFSIIQPFINYALDIALASKEAAFKDNGDFMILWILLSIQVCCFELLKRSHK